MWSHPKTLHFFYKCPQRWSLSGPTHTVLFCILWLGYYVHIDTSVGHWGAVASLRGDLVEPDTGGHCLNFWYHMYGHNVGMLQVYINDR